jgi:AraC family transcriptional regulator, arabinose operon regulatory protein
MSEIMTDQADYFSSQVLRSRRFYLRDWGDLKSGAESLLLVGGGCEWCAPDYRIDRQRLPFLAFEFVARGRGWVQMQGEEQELGVGHAFFYDPSIPHVIRADGAEPMVKYFFNYRGRYAQRLHDDLRLSAGTVLRVMEATRISSLLEEVIDHVLRGTELSLRCAGAALEHALALCADARRTPQVKVDASYATYLKCRDYLLRHYPVLSGIEPAARACHVSAAYFSRLFQRYDQETPLACLTRLKMTQALLLMNEPGAQVKGVAAQLGYKSSAHFSRVYKSWHGLAPALNRQG